MLGPMVKTSGKLGVKTDQVTVCFRFCLIHYHCCEHMNCVDSNKQLAIPSLLKSFSPMLTLSLLIMFFIFIYLVENDYENVGIDGWAEHCSIMHANTDIKFPEEYESICKAQGQDITWKDSLEPANLSKNRYNNIVACKWYLFPELESLICFQNALAVLLRSLLALALI